MTMIFVHPVIELGKNGETWNEYSHHINWIELFNRLKLANYQNSGDGFFLLLLLATKNERIAVQHISIVGIGVILAADCWLAEERSTEWKGMMKMLYQNVAARSWSM